MMLFKEINVPLTTFKIDVLIGGTEEEYVAVLKNRYKLNMSDDEINSLSKNETSTINSAISSELKGEVRFVLKLKKFPYISNIHIFIHELWHLMWHISNIITDFELNYKTQSWAANMLERIVEDVLIDNYTKIYPLKDETKN